MFYSQVVAKMLPIVARRQALRGGTGRRSSPLQTSALGGGYDTRAVVREQCGAGDSGDDEPLKVVEFGTGDGKPVINALLETR